MRRMFSLLFQAGLVVLAVRLVVIQVVQHRAWARLAGRWERERVEIPAQRGAILDRNGRVLAATVRAFSVFANPRAIGNGRRGEVAEWLAGRLGLKAEAVEARLRRVERVVSNAGGIRHVRPNYFAWVKRRVAREDAMAVMCDRLDDGGRVPGVGIMPEGIRVYPNGRMLCHVLGFVGMDGHGLAGVESRYDEVLGGEPGERLVWRDGLGRRLGGSQDVARRARDGRSLVLTIDARVQRIAEEELARVCEANRPERASVVVMDPDTGEVLAMANRPTYDPAEFGGVPAAALRNMAVSECLEPGSAFKPFTVAAAMELGVVTPETRIDCHNGVWRTRGRVLHDAHAQGVASVRDIIVYSSNIGVAQVGLRLGGDALYLSLREFGFGRPTGIGLAGESAGILRPPREWSRLTITSVPMGQEVACSPLQLAAGFCVFANGGWYVRPRIVLGVSDSKGGGLVAATTSVERRRVLSEETARAMCADLLEGVVERGTARRCGLSGYGMAGKTGTAQIARAEGGGYEPGAYTAVFVGIVPVESPRYVIAMVVKRPSGSSHYGGVVAAPGVARIAERILSMAGVPRMAAMGRGAHWATALKRSVGRRWRWRL